jgi:hypothetical protein
VEITALYEVENERFFTASFNLHMGHRLFFIRILPYKGHKECLLRKMPEVTKKLDKMLKD